MSKTSHILPLASVLVGVAQELSDGQKDDNKWSSLPNDVLNLILRYVYYTDYYRFRATCISWQNVAPSLQLKPICNQYVGSPLLFYTSNQTYKFFNPLYNVTYGICGLELSDKIVYSFSHGWLLMGVRNGHSLFFLDPITQVKINILDKPSNLAFDKMSFSSSPNSSDCLIVGVSTFFRFAKIGVLKFGEENWVIKTMETRVFYSNPIFYNGHCYCLDTRGRLVIFDPRDIRNSWWTSKQLLVPKKYRSKPPQGFLVEGNGEFFSIIVDINHSKRPVCVYKLDISKMMFEKVENLGHQVIYVSYITSILRTSAIRGEGNKVYFPTFHGKDIVFYSLATKRYYAYGDDLCKNPLSVEEEHKDFMLATWFLPKFEDDSGNIFV